MKPFCRAKEVLTLLIAGAGCLVAFAHVCPAAADGRRHHQHQSDDGGDSSASSALPSSTFAQPSSTFAQPSSSFAPTSSPSQGSDAAASGTSSGQASSGQASQTGLGASAADDGQQQSSTGNGNGNGNGAGNGNSGGQQEPHHHHGHRQGEQGEDESDASATAPASGTQTQSEGTATQGQGQGQAQGQSQGNRDATHKPSLAPAGEATRPPKTVEEWLKRLFNGNDGTQTAKGKDGGPGSDRKEPVQPASGPAATIQQADGAPASKSKPVKTAGRAIVTPAGEIPAAEILVPKLTGEGLKRALQLGFSENGNLALTQSSMARLLAPAGVSAEHALAMLNDALPGHSMGINETYHAFHAASEPTDASPPPQMATQCGSDHCFGSNLIGWRPQLQACAKKVRIGVIDTSFDSSHPTFRKRQIEVRPRALARIHGNEPEAPNWHGTGVLSILAGEPQSGTPGLIPDGKYLVADVFFADASGLPVSDTASLIEALDWLEQKHVDIVNMSLTGPHDELLQGAIERMSRKGVLFVAAVGNDGPDAPPTYPSAYAPVLAVTAIKKDLSSYAYANRGDHVDLSAPGVGIWTAMPGGKATYHSGTSFAVPYATAVAASIYSGLAVKSKDELLRHMNFVDLGAPGRDPIYGRGLVIAPYACAPELDAPAEASTPPQALPASSFVTTVSTAGEKPSGLGVPTSPNAGQ